MVHVSRAVGWSEARRFLNEHEITTEGDAMDDDTNAGTPAETATRDERQAELDAKIAAAAARLEARPDPEPPPAPPPTEVKVVVDLRLIVEELYEKGVATGARWFARKPVQGPDGAEEWADLHARVGLIKILAAGCRLILTSGNWPQPVFRGARTFLSGLAEAERQSTPAERAAAAKAAGGGSA